MVCDAKRRMKLSIDKSNYDSNYDYDHFFDDWLWLERIERDFAFAGA